jgi:hypothetical protein
MIDSGTGTGTSPCDPQGAETTSGSDTFDLRIRCFTTTEQQRVLTAIGWRLVNIFPDRELWKYEDGETWLHVPIDPLTGMGSITALTQALTALKPSSTLPGAYATTNGVTISKALAADLRNLLVQNISYYNAQRHHYEAIGAKEVGEAVASYVIPPLQQKFDELVKALASARSSSPSTSQLDREGTGTGPGPD